MRSKTLTETLYEEEVNYARCGYDKTATSHMFGYAQSGFGGGSMGGGFGGNGGFGGGGKPNLFGFDVPSVVDMFKDTPKSSSTFGSSSSYKFEMPKIEKIDYSAMLHPKCNSDYGSSRLTLGTKVDKGLRIFGEDGGAPLIRLDFEDHHGMPKNHLQYGENDYFGRHGEEAVDIFTTVFVKNTKIKFPWEK